MADKIPNINIGQVYDQRYADSELHFEHLDNLANFFGRNMPVHYHDRFYQIHIILDGSIQMRELPYFSLLRPFLTLSSLSQVHPVMS